MHVFEYYDGHVMLRIINYNEHTSPNPYAKQMISVVELFIHFNNHIFRTNAHIYSNNAFRSSFELT